MVSLGVADAQIEYLITDSCKTWCISRIIKPHLGEPDAHIRATSNYDSELYIISADINASQVDEPPTMISQYLYINSLSLGYTNEWDSSLNTSII